MILAHGIGGRSDLPIPLWMALTGAAAALLISFLVLGAWWRNSRFKGSEAGRPLPRSLQRAADSKVTLWTLKLIGLLLLAAMLGIAAAGPNDSAINPVPTWFYVWFWVGIVPISILFGPIYKKINPVRTICGFIYRFVSANEEPREVPAGWGYKPGAAGLIAFLMLELVFDRSDLPLVVGGFIGIYVLANAVMGLRFGERWCDRGDGFEVYARMMAQLSIFGRRSDGRLVIRNPLDGLAAMKTDTAFVQILVVVIGSAAFDGLTRTEIWQTLIAGRPRSIYLLLGTLGLAASILFISTTYRTAVELSERFTDKRELAGRFVHSLIPIAVGYTIAHYFSLFVFQGQAGLILASDPLGRGADLFGTADWAINYRLVSVSAIAFVQVGAIVIGHILGVVSAHDRAVELFPEQYKTRSQYSLLAVMVVYTTVGISLLVGT